MPSIQRHFLPAGSVLTVVANAASTGIVLRLADPGVAPGYSGSAIAASTTTNVGPFVEHRQYEITSLTGVLTSTIAPATSGGGRGIQIISIPIQLAAMTTSAADLLTGFTLGFRGQILSLAFQVTTLGTGDAASQVLNVEIGTTDLTGGVLTLLLADATPLGKVTQATAITGANLFSATDTISIEVAASGTVFTAGAGNLLLRVQNLDV